MKMDFRTICLIFSSLFILASCLGCGSDRSVDGTSTNSSGNIQSGSPYARVQLNRDQTGRIYQTNFGEYLDLSTGETIKLSQNAVYPSADGSEYTEVQKNYSQVNSGGCLGVHTTARIVVRDANSGRAKHAFEIPDEIFGAVRMSPNGKYFAAVWRDDSLCNGPSQLTVFDRQGNVLLNGREDLGSFDWSPESLLVLVDGGVIYKQIAEGDFTTRAVVDLRNFAGGPAHIDVSPNGNEIIFELVTGGSSFLQTTQYRYATVWAVNMDGSNLRQITFSSRDNSPNSDLDDPKINSPVWAPDGQHFLMTENYVSGGSFVGTTGFDSTGSPNQLEFAPVSSSSTSYIVSTDSSSVSVPPAAYSESTLLPLLHSNANNEMFFKSFNPFEGVDWVSSPGNNALVSGSLLLANNQMNGGLIGHIVSAQVSFGSNKTLTVTEYDLSTNVLNTLWSKPITDANNSSEPMLGVSDGRDIFAIRSWNRDTFLSSLEITDRNGDVLQDYSLQTNDYDLSPVTPFEFSPINDDILSWGYKAQDDSKGIILLNRQDGRFIRSYAGFNRSAWTHDGDLILSNNGDIYRSNSSNGAFSDPVKLFEFGDLVNYMAVSPDGKRLLISSVNRAFIATLSTNQVHQLTTFAQGKEDYASWSPDSKHVMLQHFDSLTSEFGRTHVLAADAQNVPIYHGNSTDAVLYLEANKLPSAQVKSAPYWR